MTCQNPINSTQTDGAAKETIAALGNNLDVKLPPAARDTSGAQLVYYTFDSSNRANIYTVVNPVVNSPSTSLNVWVVTNDVVVVTAGGCNQTGGNSGWRRYVDPLGPNSDRLYHGQILIPGAISTLTNLSQIIGKTGGVSSAYTIKITPTPYNNVTYGRVTIGYKDDNYGDNGYNDRVHYWGTDNGYEDQCKGLDNAYIRFYIFRSNGAQDYPNDTVIPNVSSNPYGSRSMSDSKVLSNSFGVSDF